MKCPANLKSSTSFLTRKNGEHDGVGLQNGGGDGVEVVVEGTGLPRLKAGFAGAAASDVQKGGVKAPDGVALRLRRPDKGVGHGKAVPVLPGAPGDDYNLLAHICFLPAFIGGLTSRPVFAIIVA